jgi:hypothetical protein
MKSFFEHHRRILLPDWTPSEDDILHSKAITMGVKEILFPLKGGRLMLR